MLKIGLTGGIGSGKSQVANYLALWGASVIDTDEIAHALTAAGGAAMPRIEKTFGPEVVAASGALNRPAMRQRVFDDPTARLQLESIVHPLIAEQAERLGAQAEGCYLVYV